MNSLAGSVDAVIGVDTHRDTLAAAIVTPVGAVLASTQAGADAHGYRVLLEFAQAHAPGARCWAVEGAGSYGAGLAAFLGENGEHIVEVCRPKRPPRAGARKSDAVDAVRAAREALSTEHLISPRRRGEREALRVLMSTRSSAVTARTRAANHLKALIVSAPETLRAELRGKTSDAQISYCANLRSRPSQSEREITQLVTAAQPQLLALPGVGALSAAQVLISLSHTGRFRSEAAFAAFSGAAPIPASSGLTTRHRLSRSGDRQLNRALHTIALTRTRVDPDTRACLTRRTAEGKTTREARRCLKRVIARQIFRHLQGKPDPGLQPAPVDRT